MTTYLSEILWADNRGHWVGKDGARFATREEAQAHTDDTKARNATLDEPRTILDTRISESPLKATHVWNFEHNACLSRGGKNHHEMWRSHPIGSDPK